MIVADANLIAAFCFKTPETTKAEAVFRKDQAWIAPKLWRAEFLSTLVKRTRAGMLAENQAKQAVWLAVSLMGKMEYDTDIEKTFAVCQRTQCSPYDSCYISLAIEQRTKLITFDGGILANAPDLALSPEQFLAA